MKAENIATQNVNVGDTIHGFEVQRIEKIPEIHSTAYIFSHKKTGARVVHLFNNDPNNLFSIAFRTPVHDNTGVPHILEHSVLCGSRKFPVKDPFQELLKGSLQTFLNALTYPDKTVYPVSSQVEKDFFNLVDVYCDAVFYPQLTENTFYQEGWHFDVKDPSKPIGIKGIVYNEMKGVFSDFTSHVSRKTIGALFPDTTYQYESGGEPEHITELNYGQFIEFHRKYYHPSNSYTFLFGNIPSEKTLAFLNDKYLASFDSLQIDSSIAPQQLWNEPRSIRIEAPSAPEDNGTASVILIWIWETSTNPIAVLTGSMLSHYLLGTESSPLKRALIDSGLGEDLDDLTGFDSDLVQGIFAAGLRKTKPEHAQTISDLVIKTLTNQTENGLDEQLLEGALRQVEFHLREVKGGHFPYNLRLADRCYRSWIYDGNPLAHLAFEQPLSAIKSAFKEQGQSYFIDIIKKKLIHNSHRLLATIAASSEMGKKLEQQTQQQAKELTKQFGPEDKEHFYSLTKTLMQMQKTPPSPEALGKLPKLQKSDLPEKGRDIPTDFLTVENTAIHTHPIFTSGIAYLDFGFDINTVPSELIPYLPLYSELITRCGAGKLNYEQMAKRISLSTGGIGASVTCKARIGRPDDLFFYCFFHGKSLARRFEEMLGIFSDLFMQPNLENPKQIKDILLEERNSLNASIIHSGHHFAITHASSHLSHSRYIDEILGGIAQLRFLDSLIKNDTMDKIIASLKKLHKIIITRKTCTVSITADKPTELTHSLESFLRQIPSTSHPVEKIELPKPKSTKPKGIEISAAVNFVAQAWCIPQSDAQKQGPLFLMARNLSTSYLWDTVRVEGGAYGGMAASSPSHPIFACASYRDPNLTQTLQRFEEGLREVAAGLPQDKIDQSIIGTIGRIDSPKSPHGQGLGETVDLLSGQTREYRQAFRKSILSATTDTLKKSAQMILDAKQSAITVLGSAAAFETAASEGLQLDREQLSKK